LSKKQSNEVKISEKKKKLDWKKWSQSNEGFFHV
jgi:hypothetical protein